MIEEGDKLPKFKLSANGKETIDSKDLKGQFIVLYFYPKDDTSGCTKQAISFSDLKQNFSDLGAEVVGVSPDSPSKHDKFIDKHSLSIRLIADEDKELIEAFGVWVEKSMYGRKYMGVERSTFLIDKKGKVIKIWRKVRVPGHAEKVLETIKEFT